MKNVSILTIFVLALFFAPMPSHADGFCYCEVTTSGGGTRDVFQGCLKDDNACRSQCSYGNFNYVGGSCGGQISGNVVVYEHCEFKGKSAVLKGQNYWNLWSDKLDGQWWAQRISSFTVPKDVYARMCNENDCYVFTDGPKHCLHGNDAIGGDAITKIETRSTSFPTCRYGNNGPC